MTHNHDHTEEQIELWNAELVKLQECIDEGVKYIDNLNERDKTLPALNAYMMQLRENVTRNMMLYAVQFQDVHAAKDAAIRRGLVEAFYAGYYMHKLGLELSEHEVNEAPDPRLRGLN